MPASARRTILSSGSQKLAQNIRSVGAESMRIDVRRRGVSLRPQGLPATFAIFRVAYAASDAFMISARQPHLRETAALVRLVAVTLDCACLSQVWRHPKPNRVCASKVTRNRNYCTAKRERSNARSGFRLTRTDNDVVTSI